MEKIYITFDGLTPGEAQEIVQEMNTDIEEQGIRTEIIKERKDTQELGTILAIILGSKAIVEIAKGIADYIRKRSEVKITVKKEDGTVLIENARSKDIAPVLTQLYPDKK